MTKFLFYCLFLCILNFHVSLEIECLSKCLCANTTVRCMFLHLTEIPNNLPADVVILDLRFNLIKEIPNNIFKDTKNLDTLLLNNNQITELKNDAFKGPSSLRNLYLYKNKIHTIEANVFHDLVSLEQLYLQYNRLNEFPDGLYATLSKLDRLFLQGNKIRQISQKSLLGLKSLTNLRLDGNALECDCGLSTALKMISNQNNNDLQISGDCKLSTDTEKTLLNFMNTSVSQCNDYPVFLEIPESTKTIIGGNAIFKCKFAGQKHTDIIWIRNSTQLIGLNETRYKIIDGSLNIDDVRPEDGGEYSCIGNVKSHRVQSPPARLIITSQKQDVMKVYVTPESTIALEGERVILKCNIEGIADRSKVNIEWIALDSTNDIKKDTLIKIANDLLIIEKINRSHSATYKCNVFHENHLSGQAEGKVVVHVKPEFVTSIHDVIESKLNSNLQLTCIATGYPTPSMTWYKNGNTLQPTDRFTFIDSGSTLIINSTKLSDRGMYTCSAGNIAGSIEANGELRIRNDGLRPARIIIKPFDMEAPEFTSVEIPCKFDGQPLPSVSWYKDKQLLKQSQYTKISKSGSLRLYNIHTIHSGTYECVVNNIYGNDTAQATLIVIGGKDDYILNAFKEANKEIDRAINATINQLFATRYSVNKTSPMTLMKIFRFPDEDTRNIVRQADIYARTLTNVRRHIQSGMKLNLTDDFTYKYELSPEQLELVANLSGCMTHQPVVNCTDKEFHSKYSNIDGTCNNLANPTWGASLTAFRRILKPIYENGFSTPVGWNKGVKYYGFEKPNARLVSTSLIRTFNITDDDEITHMVMQWGQFLDHDLDHAIPSTTAESWEGLDCKKTCAYSEPCFPMEVPNNDSRIHNRRCMDFIRSSAICGSGSTSVFFNELQHREQINQLTSYIDASQVYGFTRDRSFLLRQLLSDWGLLRTGTESEAGKPYLPIAGATEVDCRRDLVESDVGCFLAGDIRVNEQVGLIAMHTIWLREHNRIATELRSINPNWNGDTIFYEARKILIAEMQHITYSHWLPYIIGSQGMNILGNYRGYDENVDTTIANVFATAALRFGHSIIKPELTRLDQNLNVISQGNLPLGKAFFAPWRLVEEGGVDPLMRGFINEPAKRKKPNENLNEQLTDTLFTSAHAVSLDLAAMNIQRSRDHGIPGYNEWRKFCNISIANTFEELNEISNEITKNKLRQLYGHPGNIDVWVGGILEDQIEDARVGPTFRCLLIEQFKRMRDGDRFWYSNPTTFTNEQLEELRKSSLSRILCDNGDNITKVTQDVFKLPKYQSYKSCDDIPKVNLQLWRKCDSGCSEEKNK